MQRVYSNCIFPVKLPKLILIITGSLQTQLNLHCNSEVS